MIHIITGLPGAGKTTVAKDLEVRLNAIVINTDTVFKQMFPDQTRTERGDFPDHCLEAVYSALAQRVYELARANTKRHFIFDGTFRYHSQRQAVIDQAKRLNYPYQVIFVYVDIEKNRERVQACYERGDTPLRVDEWENIAQVYERPEEAYTICNSGPKEDLIEQIERYLIYVRDRT